MKQKLLKSMLLLCALVGGISSAWGEDYSYTFTSQQYTAAGAKTLNGVSWTMEGTGGSYFGYDGTKGQQFGSGNKPYSALTLTTSGISGTITSVVVNTSGANSISGTVAVSVDGTVFQCNSKASVNLTNTATAYTFTGEASGDVVISWAQTSSKAIYVKSITVTYSTGGGSEPSISLGSTSIEATEAAKEGTINVTYNNLTDYASEVIFYESNGTTPATYDHSWLTAGINSTTKNLEYSITANTGVARTAYLKVHAVSNDADIESNLITITQAKKSVASPEFNLEGGSYMQGTNITISSAGNTVYYNLTTDGSTPATPTKASTEYTAPIVLGSGTTKITAIAYDAYGNASGTTTRTYTGIATATLPFSWTGTDTKGKDELAKETGVAVSLGSNYAESNAPYRLKFDGVGKNVTIFTDVKPEVVTFTARLYEATAGDGSKFKVQGSADGVTYTDIEEFTIKGAKDDTFEFTTSNAFAATHRAVKLVMSSKEKNVGVGTICINCIPATLNASGYATFASTYALDFTDDSEFSAWQITGVSGNTISFSQIDGAVTPGTGVLLMGTPDATISIPVAASGTAISATNKLTGITTATAIEAGTYYGLKDNKFVKVNAGTVPAGKALLPASVVSGNNVKEFTFIFEGENETAINSLTPALSKGEGVIYNLAGQRLQKMQKGVNIVNGKKILF